MTGARECGACSLCCTVLRVDELRKLGGIPCIHQREEGGCRIHPTRPGICRAYQCLWLRGALRDDDRPDRLGAVLDVIAQGMSPWLEIREASAGAFERSTRLQEIAAEYRSSMPVRIGDVADVLDAERRFRVLLPGGEERIVEGEWTTLRRPGQPDTRLRLPRLERWLRRIALWLRRRRVAGYRGAQLVLFVWLAACATGEPDVPPLVEVEVVDGSAIHRVTVARDGSVARRSHRFADETRRGDPGRRLSSDEVRAIQDLLEAPVRGEQESVPFGAVEFRISARERGWSAECYELEVHRCPIAFRKLWQSLDEIVGDLPER